MTGVRTASAVASAAFFSSLVVHAIPSTTKGDAAPAAAAAPSSSATSPSSASFPAIGIVAIVVGCVIILLGCLSYRFRSSCPILRKARHHHIYSAEDHSKFRLSLPLQTVFRAVHIVPSDHSQLRSQLQPTTEPNPLAAGVDDIVLYTRTSGAAQGGHHWVPSFSRMYNRASPDESRRALLAPYCTSSATPAAGDTSVGGAPGGDSAARESILEEGSVHHADSTEGANRFLRAVSDGVGNSTLQPADDGDVAASVFVPSDLDVSGHTRRNDNAVQQHGELQVAVSAVEASSSHRRRHGVPSPEGDTVWMTAGIPLRFFSTSFIAHSRLGSMTAPSSTARVRASSAVSGQVARHRLQPQRSEGQDPHLESVEGTVTYTLRYGPHPQAFLPLAQLCDLSAWRLVERPEQPLGDVRVHAHVHSRQDTAAQNDQEDSAAGESEEEGMPSLLLYGSSAYTQGDASHVPNAAPRA